jgi:hypothetical protein
MSESHEAPDAEVADLVARYLDQRLDEAGRARLEQRMREEPAVLEYCARSLRFEADLQEALNPQRMEWLETRRVVVTQDGPRPEWEVQRTQTVRYGRPEAPSPAIAVPTPPKRRGLLWLLVILGLLGLGLIAWLIFRPQKLPPVRPTPSPVILRNADFEATDLSLSPRGISYTLIDWQDFFQEPSAELCEINRVSGGTIFAKSGRNVARLGSQGYLTQHLRRMDGSPVLAKPGLRLVLSGWAYAQGRPPYAVNAALRFVASSKPNQIQYEAVRQHVYLRLGGWQPFRIELILPKDLTLPVYSLINVPSAPPLDLQGRELTLSIDNHSTGSLLLDDLKIEEIAPGR